MAGVTMQNKKSVGKPADFLKINTQFKEHSKELAVSNR